MNRYDWLDVYLLDRPGAVKDFKAEWGWRRYQVGGKLFAAVCQPGPEHRGYDGRELLTLKCEPGLSELLRAEFPDIVPGFYMDKRHWISVFLDGAVPEDVLKDLCGRSYGLVFAKLTKKVQREIAAHHVTVKTERLLLRPLTVEDADDVFAWAGDERVARYMVYPTYENVEQVRAWLAQVERDASTYSFGFARISDGKLIGSGDIGLDGKTGRWKFGYNFRYDCWGMGYATEAARAMIGFAKERFGATEFSSSHCEPNLASGHVMEKCGLRFVGYGKFQKLDGSCPMRSMEYEGTL